MKRLLSLLALALSLSCAHSTPTPVPVPVPIPVPVPDPVPVPPPPFPEPQVRQVRLDAHESIQGAVLHTKQFGDLNWFPPAWTSLNDEDRAGSYDQIKSWGDTTISVATTWHYGEPGQPYGNGQLVPDGPDLVQDTTRLRFLVKDVIQHGFVPTVSIEGDNGYSYYMWAMPLVVKSLEPQSEEDRVDLTPYIKLRMCYDSCVPGWAGDHDSKQFISQAILATRAACPACVIALEFSTGYSSQGDGGAFWVSEAGQALDEADWEGNSWPPNNWEQYWEILGRWLGPLYRRPPQQVSDPGGAPWYLARGTPRGPFGVHCFEPGTYQWVRGQLSAGQIRDMYQTLADLGCTVIDMPVPR